MRIPLLLAILTVIFSVAIDIYIFYDIKKNFPKRKIFSNLYIISAVACWIFLIVCFLLPRRDATSDITFLMWAFYSYLTLYIPKFVFCFFSIIGSIPLLWKGNTIKLGKWVGLPLAVILFTALWVGSLKTRKEIDVTQVEICSPRLPQDFDNYKIVQISDLHVGTWGEDTKFIARLTDSVNAQNPDIVFFTGDIVNRHTKELEPFLKILSQIKAPDGVWSVLGNHDYGDYLEWNSEDDKKANLNLLKNWQRQIGWNTLNNASTEIVHNSDTIQLIGIENWGEPPFRQYGDLTTAYPANKSKNKNLYDSNFKILLSHNPEHWRREVTQISNIDLTLSGHTHAMQTEIKVGNWKWSPSQWRYPQWGGLYAQQNSKGDILQIYVNIGAGEVGMPFRIGAVPEITVLTLKKSSYPYSLNKK